MRKVVGVALVLAAAFCLFLLTFYAEGAMLSQQPGQATAGEEGKAQHLVSIRSALLANYGEENAAVLEIFARGGNASVFCSPQPIPRNVILLRHPNVPGIDGRLRDEISGSLQRCGFSVEEAGVEELGLAKGSLVISTAGALPAGLEGIAGGLSERGNDVLLAISLENRTVDWNGSISPSGASSHFRKLAYDPADYRKTAREAVLQALAGRAQGIREMEEDSASSAIILNSSTAYCRLFYFSDEGECRFSDSGRLAGLPGKLQGPQKVLAGKSALFSFSFNSTGEAGRNLSLSAIAISGGGEESRSEVFEGSVPQGYESKVLVGFPRAGEYVVWVEDQFGRPHAQAYVQSEGLSARQVSQQHSRYEYYLEFGGKPAQGMVRARIGSGEPKSYSASNGTVVVWAAPGPGNRSISFEHQGATAALEILGEGESLWVSYLRLYAPAAVFLAAVFLLLGAAKKQKYSITFPQLAQEPAETLQLDEKAVLRACAEADRKIGGHGLALRPEEIGRAALSYAGRKDCGMDLLSLRSALERMVENGGLVSCAGHYAPRSFAKGFCAKELVLLRQLHDAMLERGIPFSKRRLLRLPRAGMEIQVFSGKPRVLSGIGRLRRAVLFIDSEERFGFEQGLRGQDEQSVRIKIALSNGKLVLSDGSRESLGAILP